MNRQELAHILRASCTITGDANVLIVGSQAILGTYDESALPEVTTLSREADVAFLNDSDRRKADKVEGAIGEMSPFRAPVGRETLPGGPTRGLSTVVARSRAQRHTTRAAEPTQGRGRIKTA